MSDSDHEELPNNGWFDSGSDLPGILSVDSTLDMGVNVSSPSADRHIRSLDFGDSSTVGQAPIRAFQWVTYHWEGRNPVKGRVYKIPQSTRPLKASHRHRSRFTVGGPWVEGEGWDERVVRKVLQVRQKRRNQVIVPLVIVPKPL